MKARTQTERDREEAMLKEYFPDMNDADVRAWIRTTKWRMQEYEAVANAMLVSMLYALMIGRGHGAQRLREDWEMMIRAEIRRDLRVQDGEYKLAATYQNVEDYYMREELRKKGCDVLAWEKGVQMDADGNVSFARWEKDR